MNLHHALEWQRHVCERGVIAKLSARRVRYEQFTPSTSAASTRRSIRFPSLDLATPSAPIAVSRDNRDTCFTFGASHVRVSMSRRGWTRIAAASSRARPREPLDDYVSASPRAGRSRARVVSWAKAVDKHGIDRITRVVNELGTEPECALPRDRSIVFDALALGDTRFEFGT